ncbi:MAG: 8-amino-7-oxononanoate synthase [Pseudomonadota bacterium]
MSDAIDPRKSGLLDEIDTEPADVSLDKQSLATEAVSTDSDPFAAHRKALQALSRRNRYRTLSTRQGIDFSSNDYLGLAASDALRTAMRDALGSQDIAVGSGGSRLLRGHTDEHEALESEAADFFGSETALYFTSGFQANAAVLGTLPQRGDLIVYDELIHASAHEGMALSKAATQAVPHNDCNAFEAALRGHRRDNSKGTAWIVVESLYSMDGDIAPLHDLAQLSAKYSCVLIIDEAHATGVFGPNGRGLAADLEGRGDVITLHTCGKALGTMGGLVCAPRIARDFLINRARGFIYATAPPPLACFAVRAALRLIRQSPAWQRELDDLVQHAAAGLQSRLGITPSPSQIQPVILGSETRALAAAQTIQRAGFDVRAIRPPTVPNGTSRLRISINRNVTHTDIDRLIDTIAEAISEPNS